MDKTLDDYPEKREDRKHGGIRAWKSPPIWTGDAKNII